ncbi:MAG: hypothetical protein K6U03_08415, partial [Firmicutes bacterium]|nr:hypothetical protein [Bacillota bacterium]
TGKVLYNLGNDPPAIMLRSKMVSVIKEGITKTTNVLEGDNYKLRLVPDKVNYKKKCNATFFGKEQPKTGFSWGGELYYAPMSVFAFLQYLIDKLSDETLAEFSSYLQAFLQFTVGQ